MSLDNFQPTNIISEHSQLMFDAQNASGAETSRDISHHLGRIYTRNVDEPEKLMLDADDDDEASLPLPITERIIARPHKNQRRGPSHAPRSATDRRCSRGSTRTIGKQGSH